MPSPEICACITSTDDVGLASAVRDLVSLYEVRIDLIGEDWPRVVNELRRPWIACNRMVGQGGSCADDESARLEQLHRAIALGASLVDVEMSAPGVVGFIREVKEKVRVVVSHHDFERTADEEALAELVRRQASLGADICKLVTTACGVDDVGTVIRLVRRFRSEGIVAFAMGPIGMVSRVLAPLAGARFTYASLCSGHETAPGQLTVVGLRVIYDAIGAY